ncbi:MAG: AzlC family ABC transporter permease [Clostridia bacterium]|nr:AzlC family ABC transporter permease [Clostridia bacterium]
MIKSGLNFKKGIKDGLPIGLGYLSVSFAFGVQASIAGVPLLMSVFISMTNLTSAGQLAGLSIIAAVGTILEMVLTQLVINARYFLMSITLSQKLDGSFTTGHRLLCSAFVTDEIFAIAAAKPKTFGRKYFYGLVILPYFGWALGTLLGAAAGDVLPISITNALGIALYAMFIAIIVPPTIKVRGVAVAVSISIALSCTFYFVPIFSVLSEGFRYIISALIASAVTAAFFPVKSAEEDA